MPVQSLVDEFLPVFDVSDSVATVVEADLETTWTCLMDVDFMDVGRRRPLVAALGAVRAVPSILLQVVRGEGVEPPPDRLRFADIVGQPPDHGGWLLLGERRCDEIALGLVGRFWRPRITFQQVSVASFRDFSAAGYAKTIYALSVRPLDGRRTLLVATMRTATTDARSRRWFRRYWTLGVGSGAHILAQGLVDSVATAAARVQANGLFADE